MWQTKKTTSRKRVNRSLAFLIREQNKNELGGRLGSNPLKMVQTSPMSGNSGSPKPDWSPSGSSGYHSGIECTDEDRSIRISSVPKFVTAADSRALLRDERSGKKRTWNGCSSKPAVREQSFFSSPASSPRSMDENSPFVDDAPTSKYFKSSYYMRNDFVNFDSLRTAATSEEENVFLDPFKQPAGAFQTPWITRGGAVEEIEMYEDQGVADSASVDSSVSEIIDSLFNNDEDDRIQGPLF